MEPDAHRRSRAQFQAQAANYGKSHILADTRDVQALLADLPRPDPGTPALDIATGGGHCAAALARFGYSLSVCDITPAMVEQARQLLAEEGFPPPHSALADAICPAESLPYPDASFALVACRVAPHHFAQPDQFVREAARVLRPGGHFLLIDGSLPDEDPATAAWLNDIEKLRDPSHERLLSRAEWLHLVNGAQLQVLHAELTPFSMPDLDWYFATAATSDQAQAEVRESIREASPDIRRAMQLQEAPDGKISWTWQRLGLLAQKLPA